MITRQQANNHGEKDCIIFAHDLQLAMEEVKGFNGSIISAYPFISAFGAKIFAHSYDDIKALKSVQAITHEAKVYCLEQSENYVSVLNQYPALSKKAVRGKDITVAVIDTGITPYLDFTMPFNRIVFKDFLNGKLEPYDDNGHGTAVAGILAGNGLLSFGDHQGVVNRANIVAIKAIGSKGEGGAFEILKGMQWLYENKSALNVKVVCMSFGSNPVEGKDPLSIGVEALVDSGITVVTSAGNDGKTENAIKSPGICKSAITVGALNTMLPEPKVADFSSVGGENDGKPDLVAAGVKIVSVSNMGYKAFSGTSMATPIVAGAAALILEDNPDLTPKEVKELILSHLTKVEANKNECGGGALNLDFLFNSN